MAAELVTRWADKKDFARVESTAGETALKLERQAAGTTGNQKAD